MARVLFNHGLGNRRPETHWIYRAAVELRKQGHQVSYPQFPNPDEPNLAEWEAVLIAEARLLAAVGESAGELIFIGHSLGTLNFIQSVQHEALTVAFDRVLFVAPSDPALLHDLPIGELADLLPSLKDDIHRAAGKLTIVGSDQDVWQPNGVQATFGDPLGVQAVVVPGAKHFSDRDGWGPWQGVIDWVLDPGASLANR